MGLKSPFLSNSMPLMSEHPIAPCVRHMVYALVAAFHPHKDEAQRASRSLTLAKAPCILGTIGARKL